MQLMHDVLSVVIAGHRKVGSGVAELWCGPALLGILHEENAGLVLRLESHARGPLTVNAVALERALAEARERLADRRDPALRVSRIDAVSGLRWCTTERRQRARDSADVNEPQQEGTS